MDSEKWRHMVFKGRRRNSRDNAVETSECATLVVRFFMRVPILQFLMSPFPCCDEVFRIPAPAEGLGIMGIVVGDIIVHCRDARLQ